MEVLDTSFANVQARDIAARLGYTDPPVDTFDKFSYENEYHARAPQTTGQRFSEWFLIVLGSIVFVGALWLALSNFRAGRGDTRGALRLAATD